MSVESDDDNDGAGSRKVPFGSVCDVDIGSNYVENSVKTSKYTVLTFLPLNLFEQLNKAANVYFLIISLLMWLGESTTLFVSSIAAWTTASQLVLMMSASAIMAAIDDCRRHQADNKMNQQKAKAIRVDPDRGISFERIDWSAVNVGDILILVSGEELPADLVPLASSGPDGMCYVSTASLDGETNLKIKAAASATQAALCGPSSPLSVDTPLLNSAVDRLCRVGGVVTAEAPTPSIHSFTGTLQLEEGPLLPLDPKNLLLRGTQLRNTAWCFGVVVYTGRETRLIQNSRKAPVKIANLEYVINKAMCIVLVVQAILALVGDLSFVMTRETFSKFWYLGDSTAAEMILPEWIGYFFTFFILYCNLMPISLYATMEVCNVFQAYFIKQDMDMYDAEQDCPATVRSTNLCHELGQVSYIFSDKTGTLTQNVMELKRISVGGQIFGSLSESRGFMGAADMQRAQQTDARQADAISSLLEVLAVSHTVVVAHDGQGKSKFEAESPDEGALVEGAAALGWSFLERRTTSLVVSVADVNRSASSGATERRVYQLEALNAFSSARKRMSVVVVTPAGDRVLLVKGADNVMLERAVAQDPKLVAHLEEFANEGLRTLVIGRRRLDDSEFKEWRAFYDAAAAAPGAQEREARLEEAAERIERNLEILGATAVEDRLQVGVQETVERIRAAGIRFWVLTGDKLETARIIGYSSRVLSKEMDVMVLEAPKARPESEARDALEKRMSALLPRARRARRELDAAGGSGGAALLVTGAALEAVTSQELQSSFLELADACVVVIACRVSPKQKAEVVRLVRTGIEPNPVTLSIGDGANDVPMIQEAQVGVGIEGREGRQAVNSADFAIAQFSFLQRLLLVHGRWDYRRSCKVIHYSFWKNAVLTLLLFYYTTRSGFSGTSLFEDMVWNSFNPVLAFPIIATGIMDRDLSASDALEVPELYVSGREGLDLNQRKMAETMLSAVVHALIIMIVMTLAFTSFTLAQVGDYYTFGTSVYTWLIISMNYRVAFITTTWNWISIVAWLSPFVLYSTFIVIYCRMTFLDPFMYKVDERMIYTPLFWICCLAVPALAIMVDIFKAYLVLQLRPDRNQLILEAAQAGKLKATKTRLLRSIMSSVKIKAESLLRKGFSSAASSSRSSSDDDGEGTSPPPPARTAMSSASGTSFGFDMVEGGVKTRTQLAQLETTRTSQDTSLVDGVRWYTRRFRSPARSPVFGGGGVRLEETQSSGSDEESGEENPSSRGGQTSNRPSPTRFAQQALPSFQLVWSGTLVGYMGLVVGALLFLLSAIVWIPSANLPQLLVRYDGAGADTKLVQSFFFLKDGEMHDRSCSVPDGGVTKVCDIEVVVPRDMEAPIRIMYIVDPFYQNYNTYIKSFLWSELDGSASPPAERESARALACPGSSRTTESGQPIYPCGLIATSLFNDSFYFPDYTEFITTEDVASRDASRYANPAGYPDGAQWKGTSWLYERYPTIIEKSVGVQNRQFVTWMRPGALPRIAKAYGTLNANLAAGATLRVRIAASFPVSSLSGVTKHLLLTKLTPLGGRNEVLGLVLAISGCVCVSISILTRLFKWWCPRRKGRPRFESGCWSVKQETWPGSSGEESSDFGDSSAESEDSH